MCIEVLITKKTFPQKLQGLLQFKISEETCPKHGKLFKVQKLTEHPAAAWSYPCSGPLLLP